MREVRLSGLVIVKIVELESYLIDELKLSEEAALGRIARIRKYLQALRNAIDYPLCRFKKWQALGYRCGVFEKDWVFAYEIFEDGIIVRDMSHTSLLAE
jgi:hypothetical protein